MLSNNEISLLLETYYIQRRSLLVAKEYLIRVYSYMDAVLSEKRVDLLVFIPSFITRTFQKINNDRSQQDN